MVKGVVMDWLKLIGLSGILFMLLEILSAKLAKFKTSIVRAVVFIVMAGASLGLAATAPAIAGIRGELVVNACAYFVTEYFLFLFLRNELNISLKKFILSKFGGFEDGGGK
jgi:hypothetical protein